MQDITTICNLLNKIPLEETEKEDLYALLRGMTAITFLARDNMHQTGFLRLDKP